MLENKELTMFVYRTRVRLKDTDATGVLYFTEQFRMAQEVFEEFLKERGFGLNQLLHSPYLMPVVHAKADFLAPLFVGNELEIAMRVSKIGTSSLTLSYTVREIDQQIVVGTVEIVHVVVDAKTKAAMPIPDELKEIFVEKEQVNTP
jgi:1,4-dihydroxy-2-naphthoyl-CoA hydrolase